MKRSSTDQREILLQASEDPYEKQFVRMMQIAEHMASTLPSSSTLERFGNLPHPSRLVTSQPIGIVAKSTRV